MSVAQINQFLVGIVPAFTKWLLKQRPEVVFLCVILCTMVYGMYWAANRVEGHIDKINTANSDVTTKYNEAHKEQMSQQLATFERVHAKDAEDKERSHQLIRDLLRAQGVDISELKPTGVAVINPKEKK